MESRQIPIKQDLDVFAARRAARDMAQALGFGPVETTAIETAVSELAANVLRHAGEGALTLRPLMGQTPGLEVNCEDRGPGIADVEAALRDGHTPLTPPVSGGRGGLGIGLGGARRLMDELEIESRPGNGTRITARKWAALPALTRKPRHEFHELHEKGGEFVKFVQFVAKNPPWHIQVAAASRPAAGATASGDAWLARDDDGRLLVALADGLGHGEEAARAAQKALAYIEQHLRQSLSEIMQGCHTELQGTRGAALGLARLEPNAGAFTYAGIGNTDIRLADSNPARPISLSGIVGYTLRRVREETFPCAPGDLILMHTDGISERFDLDALLRQTPDLQELTETLVREYGRENDDATVVVARIER